MKNKIVIFVVCLLFQTDAFATEPQSPNSHTHTKSAHSTTPVLLLSDAIQRAINASPRLKSVKASLEAAKGAEDQANSWLNPEMGFEADNIAGTGQYSGTDSAEYTIGLSQTVEIGGKRSAKKKAAQSRREAANTEVVSEKLNLTRDVHIAYSNVLAKSETVKLAINQEQLAKGVLAAVSKRVEAAAEPEIQQSKAEVAYITSGIVRQQEEQHLEVAKEKLARLWGASTLDVALDHSHFFDVQAPEAIHIYREKLRNIPDRLRLTHLIEEKKSWLKFEKAQAIPDPKFNLGVRNFREDRENAFLFGVSIPIPVFNQNRGNITKARAQVTKMQIDTRQAELMLEQELTENWQQWTMSFSEATLLRTKLLPSAEKAFTLARTGYEKGKFPYLEVLDAQRTLFNARAQYHESLKNYHSSRANVERLTTTIGDE